ncbi:aminodeoxychorismate synthase component 1 [mine drainage metagenome]|uniref:Aminodeoxychorismate synthase component 1 n=1 Tax=mine drainage metagenome TaxID=410659 RepID=A0A1J5T8Z4_9ZZZZ
MLGWINRFNICCLLDNHQYSSKHSSIECIAAAGSVNSFTATENVQQQLKIFLQKNNDWLFGHVSYDFKNKIEPLQSDHFDGVQFPDIFLFQPEVVIKLSEKEVEISSVSIAPKKIFDEIIQEKTTNASASSNINPQPRIPKEKYLQIIQQLKQHILRGDCYEINFCQEFFAEETMINPLVVYHQLTKISPSPFACFYKLNDKYLLCASPERYIKKTNNNIISQPIKGTFKRDLTNRKQDESLKKQLRENAKERSENVMVVDMVRNDLSKICKEATVVVEELFGVYSFPQVHQMISTISGELQDDIDFADVLHATFPMASMTGAPKRKVMELIEQYEQTKRGIYSGCVGYISPEKDFDFNVVIRSIAYNQSNKYLSYQVGGGITFNSDAEKEYEECLLKAEAIKKVLQNKV